jgi:hypothetical protein
VSSVIALPPTHLPKAGRMHVSVGAVQASMVYKGCAVMPHSYNQSKPRCLCTFTFSEDGNKDLGNDVCGSLVLVGL